MKHKLISLLLILCPVSFLCPPSASAVVGQWTVRAMFAPPATKIIDTGSTVYYLSGGSLFSYDRKNEESHSYTMNSGLNSPTVTDIFYNPAKHYLLLAHSSGNIDLLYDDGHIVNMSDISDSSIEPPLTINDVCFSDNSIYAATNFGLVEFNDIDHEVVQSGIFNRPVTAVAETDGNIVISSEGFLRSIVKGDRFPTLDKFTSLCPAPTVTQILPLGDGRLLLATTDHSASLSVMTPGSGNPAEANITTLSSHTPGFHLTAASDGHIYFNADGKLFTVNPESLVESTAANLPDSFDGCVTGTSQGLSAIWSLTRDGLACHKFTGQEAVQITGRFKPESFSVKTVCYLTPSADGRRLYVTNNGTSVYRFDKPMAQGYNRPLTASYIDLVTDEATDITPYPVEAHLPDAAWRQRTAGKFLLSPTAIAPDPDNAATFFASSTIDGVYKMTDGKLEGIYSELNSPLFTFDQRNIAYHVNIDRGGNLWLHTTTASSDATPIFVLPAAKRKLKPADVKKSDWITLATKPVNYVGGQDVQVLHTTRSNITFVTDHNANHHFLAYDDRGTRDNFTDDRIKLWTRLIDQDGNIFSPAYCSALCEDRDGAVWIGTDKGVIVIANPANAINDNMTVRRVKVPKNDGTNSADYLLGADMIYSISVDAANRKWIATELSGLFLVSPDGSEILENFTTDNSPLPSNSVYSVYASPQSNIIYVGTPEGLFSYESNATPAMESFDDITVFPNPVTPDYSGPIYVKGLMDGSLVKIADSAGRVLYQGYSEGGLFTWDGINSAGADLPSGVYYIFASQSADGSSSGGTAKFMIIR